MDKQKLDALRRTAEEVIESAGDDFQGTSGDELRTALHELHVYQIELEVQNDELRRVQEELVVSRDQYRDLYDFAPVGYLTISADKLIKEANLTAADLLGEERKALLGQPFTRFIVDDDQDTFYFCYRDLTATSNPLACELRMRKKDGYWFWARLECVPGTEKDTDVFRIRVALHDTSETKRLEAEVLKAKKLEATALLAGGIAHDFNNLLTVIFGNIEMAEENIQLGQPAAEQLHDALVACHNARDLVNHFLNISSSGRPNTLPTSVEALITASIKLAVAGAGSRADFECALPADLWPVAVDTGQITRAIGNVMTNAIEAMPLGGIIRIDAENSEAVQAPGVQFMRNRPTMYVKIAIRDHGKGISADNLPQVLDPYFTTKDLWSQKGLGLGLTVTSSIIKQHGGSIDIASQPDTGTTVTIYLPANAGYDGRAGIGLV